jgi:uncharacterized protein (TIGR02996 family)
MGIVRDRHDRGEAIDFGPRHTARRGNTFARELRYRGVVAIERLLSAIERDPEDLQHYLVLADALTQGGDPRGELIAVHHALATRGDADRAALEARASELVAARRARVLGDLAGQERITLGYRLGFLHEVALRGGLTADDASRALAMILTSPEARFLRTVAIDPEESGVTDRLLCEIFDKLRSIHVPPSLRRLALGNAYRRDAGYRFFSDYIYAFEDDLSDLLAVVPSIAELRLDLGAVALAWQRSLASEHLQKFEYVSPYVRPDELEVLAASRLPALESFVLWTGSQILVNESSDVYAPPDAPLEDEDLEDGPYTPYMDEQAIEGEDLGDLLAMLERCPALRELGICNFAGAFGGLLDALASTPVLGRLEALDLSCCRIDGSIIALLDRAPRLRTLRIEGAVIDATTHAGLSSRAGLELVGTPHGDAYEHYRYVVTQE